MYFQIGRYRFCNLSERQKYLATMFQAYQVWKSRVNLEKYRDWEPVANEVRAELKRWPTDDEIRPLAIKVYQARITSEISRGVTEDSKRVSDWHNAENELKRGLSACLPVTLVPQIRPSHTYGFCGDILIYFGDIPEKVTLGDYNFKDLTPEQKHLAINEMAQHVYGKRLKSEEYKDWEKAAAEVRRVSGGRPRDWEIRPIAQRIYDTRMADSVLRSKNEKEDWYEAERGLNSRVYSCTLPVVMVPQIKPSRTWQILKAA